MKKISNNRFKKRSLLGGFACIVLCSAAQVNADVGKLLWEDNFNQLNPSLWQVDVGDGCDQNLCGWGNQELQWYAESNVYIDNVPGEAGNNALVLEVRNEESNGYGFTSGKVESSNKISVQYGMIEVRMQVPEVGIGLWPAAWMLGTAEQNWPKNGEIDIMEMGHKAQARAEAGFPGADINSYVGSNLIFHTPAACSLGNPTCAASTAYQNDNAHVSNTSLANRFVTYRTYWTETQIRFTVEDNGVEIDMYDAPFTITDESSEFQAPYYFLLNLAVGGNFTDAQSNNDVTAQRPAKMYIDYVRVYELDGQGEVFIDNQTVTEAGTFGVFTDNTPTDNKLEVGQSSDVYIWNQNSASAGTIPAIEGDNVIAWEYTASNEWFGGGVQAREAVNLSHYNSGALSFKIKIPADVSFKVGIEDTDSNQNWVEFPANTTVYDLVRNGDWATVTIPTTDIRGDIVSLESLKGLFYIASLDGQLPQGPFEMAVDDIVWTSSNAVIADLDNDGVNDNIDQCTNTPANTAVDAKGCSIVIPIIIDSDNDGVNDDIDQCPNTPANTSVDANGCSIVIPVIIDNDNDGVLDNIDQCLGTAAGVTVDSKGCKIVTTSKVGVVASSATSVEFFVNVSGWADVHYRVNNAGQQNLRMTNNGSTNVTSLLGLTDGDVVEYFFTYQQENGSAKDTALTRYTFSNMLVGDSDNDGINNDIDQCANTPVNSAVDAIGCSIVIPVITDSDNDGVLDNIDQCLGTAAGVAVDSKGCKIVTTSKLGVVASSATSVEFFVNVSGWADVHYSVNNAGQQNLRMTNNGSTNVTTLFGLTDGDVIDYSFTYQQDNGSAKDSDVTRYTFGSVLPVIVDSDNDGVNNDIDQCANTPVNTAVDGIGCPLDVTNPIPDIDADGVPDAQDQCPNTVSGVAVNALGCDAIVDVIEVASVNNILVGGAGSANPGHSLYVFDNDLNTNGSNCNDDCMVSWPPLLISDGVATGVGSLGTITRSDGTLQATYNNRPLYFYANDTTDDQTNGQGLNNVWWTVDYGTDNVVPLFSSNTVLEQAISFKRDGALVTRFADRGRDRHAREDHFQVYDHYLDHYWEHRTAQFELVDYVVKGEQKIAVTMITEWKLTPNQEEFRTWFYGLHTVAEYHGNFTLNLKDSGSYDHNFNKISDVGNQYRYTLDISQYQSLGGGVQPLAIGQRMEFEPSQFLDAPPQGRSSYYGTTYLYIVGQGLVPWKKTAADREDSYPIDNSGWLGGKTTLSYNYTDEPDNHFMQMPTNLSNVNGQSFVEGRRIHHTNFITGMHDEQGKSGRMDELMNKAGTHYVNSSCSSCHERNGRAPVADVGQPLDKWVFKVAGADGQADPNIGSVLQPSNRNIDPALGEGSVSITSWTENNGLRSPNYNFSKSTPAFFSARLAPQLVGLGLLEAISETTVLEREDVNDADGDGDGDGISGKAQLSIDPVSGETRLGRFGYKAAASSIKHQVAAALNTDMGVMTSVKPTPDCGPAQATCGNTNGSELSDENLTKLVKYVSLLGVRAQRDLDNRDVILGEQVFNDSGCESCHRDTMQTSEFAPLSELRSQTIRPFTDLLLHDMGEGLADNLGEGEATGAEWRTAPLWGLGLSACVTGGLKNPTGNQGDEVCTPDASYLHDGRARTIEEAILWHGGEGENSRIAYESLSSAEQNKLLSFLKSL